MVRDLELALFYGLKCILLNTQRSFLCNFESFIPILYPLVIILEI